ncbi:MAG TPA: pteridine reductase [Xanthomonadaceae bacterium]|nr:pteridine reductase [Xanthomonadaceae bacterium]
MNPSTNPVALVTGAARRVGAAITRHLHAHGFEVVIHHRASPTEAAALAAQLDSRRAASALVVQADLGDIAALQGIVDATIARFGHLDALVNNASAFHPTPIGRATGDDWAALFDSNAKGPFFLAQAAAPHLRSAGGAIVNLVDVYGDRPLREHTIYSMAKAANAMLVKSLAVELGPEVRVNGVSPGAILWPEAGKSETAKAAMLAKTALKRVGSPDDIAEAVRWLLQDARYTTGQILAVDGGRLLNL